jgi:hypothetical protein
MARFDWKCNKCCGQSKPSQSNPANSSNTGSKPDPIPPARVAKIEEMLTLTGLKPTLEQRIAQEKRQLKWYALVQSSLLKEVPKDKEPEEQGITAAYVKDMNGLAEAQLTWEKIKPSIIQYCAHNFYRRADRQHHGFLQITNRKAHA